MKLTKQDAEQILSFFQKNNIILVNIDYIGHVNLNACQVDDDDFIRLMSENDVR